MPFTRKALENDDGYRDIYISDPNEVLDVEIPIPATGEPRGFTKFLAQISILDTAESPTNYSHNVYCYRKCKETGTEEPITDGYLDFSVATNQKPSGSLLWPKGERWIFRPGDKLVIRGSTDTHTNQVVVDWASE